MFEGILRSLQQPEYIHVLINPSPVYGLAMGLIGLFVAVCQQSRRATIAALVIVLISAAAAWPVYEFGEQAYDRVLSMSDDAGRTWLSTHKARAEQLIWFFYALAILSVIALIVPIKWPRSSVSLAYAVLVLGALCLGSGGYIAYAGGKIRHIEFRNVPIPQGSPSPAAPSQPANNLAPATAQVTIKGLTFSPGTIEIRKGETVGWENKDLTPHTVTSQGGSELNSGSIEAEASWTHTFPQTGTFPYFCTFHDEMKGTIIVK